MVKKKFVKASRLVEAIQAKIEAHGDVEVCLEDPSTLWSLPPWRHL